MESLSYAFEGRAMLFTDDTDFQLDGLIRNKNPLKKWDGEDAVESMGYTEPRLPDTAKKSFLGNQCFESSGDDTINHSGKSVESSSTISLNSLMEFGARFSSSVNKANDEKLVAPIESNGNRFSIDQNSVLSSPQLFVSTKRLRITNLQSPVPTCQVYGCNKDLSSSKDYHKRHKVCDVHSKTPVVIVNGIQQRFCQQCSRFHILAEFDEGKRSCRKRLAGHNKRRRKPQFDTYLDASKASLIFSKILPSGFIGLQYNVPSNQTNHLYLDEKPIQSLQKSVLRFHGVGKQYPSKNCLNAPLPLPEFSVGPDSRCALSLLSAPAQNNISSNSEGISMAHPLISKENYHANLFAFQNSGIPFGESALGVKLERLPVISSTSDTPQTAIPQERDTVNLLELSLHLQRVEEQRYYGEVKMESGIFCDSTIT